VTWSLLLLGTEYAVALLLRGEGALEGAAPLVGAGLLLAAELAYWSIDLSPGPADAGLAARRLGAVAGLAAGSLALGSLVIVLTTVPLGGGLAWDLVGIAAAAATLALIARLARGPGSSREL
jgi:hypothetical protein